MGGPFPDAGMTSESSLSGAQRLLLALFLLLVVPAALLFVIEGGTSFLLFGREYLTAPAPSTALRAHVAPDTLLGWVNRPNQSIPNEYGAGIGLTTTALGFRSTDRATPADTAAPRLVCSGDSYVLGVGVGDAPTWCAQLAAAFPGLQTINMGQEGYGLDQSFLSYRRDGTRLGHDVVLFAVTDLALERATTTDNDGRSKPSLGVDGGALRATNVPVPPPSGAAIRRATRGRQWNELRLAQLLNRLPSFNRRARAAARVDAQWDVFERAFDELNALTKGAARTLVLVYLPTGRDLQAGPGDGRRARLVAYAARRQLRVIDLTPAMRAMRPDSLDLAFIVQPPPGAAPGVRGQYSVLGHTWVARALAARLSDVPALVARRVAPRSR